MKFKLLAVFLLLITISSLFADFYDAEQVNTIKLYFTQSNWDQLLDNLYAAGDEDRLLGTAVINGVTYDSVGVRYKGNSSYSANRAKNPFNIKLDYVIDDQLMDGKYGTIKLANGFSDPSFVRETLAYEIARKYMPASMANYANVYVNDVLIGTYTNVQDVDSYFMRTLLHCDDKPRFKCDTNTMSSVTVWGYLGQDSTAYSQYYGIESDYGWADLINFTNVLNNDQNNIASVMNVDQNLWMVAFDNLLVSLDSPINIFHNFYLFGDASNRINPIVWDLNMTFGGFGAGGGSVTQMQQYNPLQNLTNATFPIISHVLSNTRYKKMYIAHMRTMINENFANGWYATRAAALQTICGPSVQADPNYFYTYANFQANLNSQVSGGGSGGPGGAGVCGITQLMGTRSTYLLNSSPFQGTVPTITAIDHTPEVVTQNGAVNFTLTATNATYAQIGVRQNIADQFSIYQMYDDGQHNDGNSGDGVYGVTISLGIGDLQYYGYVENSSQGAFLPERAEHEFFTLALQAQTNNICINEITAKNTTYADPNGDFDDWVELYNLTDNPIDIGGMYMVDSHYSDGASSWTQIPTGMSSQTTIPAHGFLVIWFDEETSQGPLHVNDKLSGSADAVYLIDSDGSTVIDTYTWTAETGLNTDNISVGRVTDGGSTWTLFGTDQTLPCTPGATNQQGTTNTPPTIVNVQYSPHQTTENSSIDISASVTDTDNNLSEVLLLWGLGDYTLHSVAMTQQSSSYSAVIGPFSLNSVIQYRIKATDTDSATVLSPIYQIIIGFSAPMIFINEIMASNTASITDNHGEYEDWVEIYNPTDTAINLSGYYLMDNHYYDSDFTPTPISSAYPDSTTIPAHGYKVFWFDESPDQGVLHINAKLGLSADGVYLLAPDMLTIIDSISWTADLALAANQSYGRQSDGSTGWTIFGLTTEEPVSPGSTNESLANNDDAALSTPQLSIYPNPCSDHLNLELKNSKTTSAILIYNVKGQLVTKLFVEPGTKRVWNVTDSKGRKLPNGLYIAQTNSGKQHWTKKICIMH